MMYNCFIINGSNRIKLHEADAGSAVKCIGMVKQPLNGIDNFTFSIHPDNPCYDSIDSMLSLAEVRRCDNGKLVYKGRVLKPTGSMESGGLVSKKYISEGELSYLCDSIQPYQTISGNLVTQRFITQALSVHNNAMPESKKIYVGRISVSGSTPSSHTWHYVSTWQAFKDYISKYGGEIRLRYGDDGKRYLDYTDTIWASGSDTPIELAVNMQSVSFTVDPTSIASGIYAVGAKLSNDGTSAKRLELGEVIWNEALRAKYGDIVACITWDDVTLESNLREKAVEWLTDQSGELHQYSVSAVELSHIDKSFDEFEVGTQYPIKNPLIGLDDVVRCIGRTIDINDPTKTKLTFGDKYETLTALTSARNAALSTQINNFAADITEQQQAYAQHLVETQTALLTGAEGGYVYQHLNNEGKPQETFYLNSPDIETATQAIRINQNGIGFWDASAQTPAGSALEGPYKDAWTIDGQFHTEYICGKAITGFTFNNGDGTFEVKADGSVTAKKLTIKGGSIDIETNNKEQSKIDLHFGDYLASFSPYRIYVTEGGNSYATEIKARNIVHYVPENGSKFVRYMLSDSGLRFFDASGYEILILSSDGFIAANGYISTTERIVAQKSITTQTDVVAQGDVKAASVHGNDIYLKLSDSGGYISLREYINNHP